MLGTGLVVGCASLPPTTIPLCDGTFNVLCRAPVEMDRSLLWESVNACTWPWEPPESSRYYNNTPRGVPEGLCACYRFAGAEDGYQVYSYELRSCQ